MRINHGEGEGKGLANCKGRNVGAVRKECNYHCTHLIHSLIVCFTLYYIRTTWYYVVGVAQFVVVVTNDFRGLLSPMGRK